MVATGYILKSIEGDTLIQAIKDAYNGDIIYLLRLARKLAAKFISSENNIVNIKSNNIDEYGLTDREKEICSLLVSGYINKQICEKLFFNKWYCKKLRYKWMRYYYIQGLTSMRPKAG